MTKTAETRKIRMAPPFVCLSSLQVRYNRYNRRPTQSTYSCSAWKRRTSEHGKGRIQCGGCSVAWFNCENAPGRTVYSWIYARIFVDSYVAKDPERALVVDSIFFKSETWLVCSNKTDVEVRDALKQQWDMALDKCRLAHIYSQAGYREWLLTNKDHHSK